MANPSVLDQVKALMFGAEYGDTQLRDAMERELLERLTEAQSQNRPLRVYVGYDPSRPDLHLGHSITMRKLRQFQDFGHDVIFVVGTFTAQIGDTSDKSTGRPRLDLDQVLQAGKTYAEQAFKILDRSKTTVAYNHEWLGKLTMTDVVSLASNFTVQQFLVRDNYHKRIEANNPIGLHEFLYALMQGYDAVHLRADVQMGATEQLFNILAGRKLQQAFGQKGCVCITFPILVGTDGKMRMSKSAGNYVGLAEPPEEQFGKIMSISDETMLEWIKYVVRWPIDQIKDYTNKANSGQMHPMDLKKALASEIVDMYHGQAAAVEAQAHFERVHQQRKAPEEIEELQISAPTNIIDLLSKTKGVGSRSQARRLIEGKGVKFDNNVVDNFDYILDHDGLLQVGKRRFLQIKIGNGG